MREIITVTLNPSIDRLVEVEGLQLGAHAHGRLLARVPAGKGINVSRALSALGISSMATGFVGARELDAYQASLEKPDPEVLPPCMAENDTRQPYTNAGIRCELVAVDGLTRENITLLDSKTHVETHIRDRGFTVGPGAVRRLRDKLVHISKPGALVLLSGSIPPGVSVQEVVRLVDAVKSGGADVAVDGPGELLVAVKTYDLCLIKPNLDELAAMLGVDTSSTDAIVRSGLELAEEVRYVMVSRGAQGAFLFNSATALVGRCDLDPTRVKSTVGCGDALVAGFIAAQRYGQDARASFRHALAVAAAAAMEAVPGRFTHGALDGLLANAQVDALA